MQIYTFKNGEKAIIRKAIVSDAQKILDYVNQISGESDNLTFGKGEFDMTFEEEEKFLKNVEKDSQKLFVVAIKDNQVIANGSLICGSRPRTAHKATLGISVLKDYWHQGLGTALMDYLLEWSRSNINIRKIDLQVREDNENAIALYKKCGFQKEGHIKRFFKIDQLFYDAIQMGLNID